MTEAQPAPRCSGIPAPASVSPDYGGKGEKKKMDVQTAEGFKHLGVIHD